MTELSADALEALRALANGPGSIPPGPVWDELSPIRYIMGSHQRTHVTQKGKAFIVRMMAN